MSARVNIASGEDVPFVYEPSNKHTYESFRQRQLIRLERAKRDQQAIEGSVNEPLALPAPATPVAPPKVIYLRDESGFGECCVPAILDVPHDGTGYCGC